MSKQKTRKIAANYLCLEPGLWLKNGIISIDANNRITDITDTKGQFRETAGVEFYNGVIVPGWTLITESFSPKKIFPDPAQVIILQNEGCIAQILFNDRNLSMSGDTDDRFYIPFSLVKTLRYEHSVPVAGNMANLFSGPSGNILWVSVSNSFSLDLIENIWVTARQNNAIPVFSGEIEHLYKTKDVHRDDDYFFLIPVKNFLDSPFTLKVPAPDFSKHILLLSDADLPRTGSGIANILHKITRAHPWVTFDDLLTWISVNPFRLIRRVHEAGVIRKGFRPGVTLIAPFNFEKMSLLPDSRFRKLV